MAVELVDEAIDFADELGVDVYDLPNNARVLDFGVESEGGVEAGLLLTEIQTAQLATVSSRLEGIAGAPVPHVELTTDHPGIALLCSQRAEWTIETEGFGGLGSGPARALVGREPAFRAVGYHDAFEFAVLTVETDRIPDEAVTREVAEAAEVEESGVFLCAFPTASVAGSTSVAARAPELAVNRLFELGYDLDDVVSVTGTAPVAPIGDEETALARTNDALSYGGRVHLTVREDFDRFDELVSSTAAEHGRPFEVIFEEADWDFDRVPHELFAPAQVTVDVVGGPVYTHGGVEEDVLADSFGL